MGHIEKGLVPFKGEPMITYAIDALRPVSEVLAISCNQRQSDYLAILNKRSTVSDKSAPPTRLAYWLVEDGSLPFAGPVAGIISFLVKLEENLRTAGGIKNDALCVVSSCDMPLLTQSTIEFLIEQTIERSLDGLHFARNGSSTAAAKDALKGAYLPMVFNAKTGLSIARRWANAKTPLPASQHSLRNWLTAVAQTASVATMPQHADEEQLVSINTLETLQALEDKLS